MKRIYNNRGVKLHGKTRVRKRGMYDVYDIKRYKGFKNRILKQIDIPHPSIVPVYKFIELYNKEGLVVYEYDMAKCKQLSAFEHSIVDGYSMYGSFSLIENRMLSASETETLNKLKAFISMAKKLRYMDLHPGNVMKYKGRYVLIDLEGFG